MKVLTLFAMFLLLTLWVAGHANHSAEISEARKACASAPAHVADDCLRDALNMR